MKNLDAIVVLSAGIKYLNGKWVNTDLLEDEKWGAPGGKLRVLAADYLWKKNPSQIIIACGGKGWEVEMQDKTRPSLSTIIKQELIDLGVESKSIFEENQSNNTYEALLELGKIIQKNKLEKISIISNCYHLARIKAMLKYSKDLAKFFNKIIIKIISAEEMVLKYDEKKWQKTIEKAYNSPQMKLRILAEKKGIKDLQKGIYQFNY